MYTSMWNDDTNSEMSGSSSSQHLSSSESNEHSNTKSVSSHDNTRPRDEDHLVIARPEDKAVFRIRLAVIGFLLCCTVAVATIVYLLTRKGEEDAFESAFIDFGNKVFESLGSGIVQSLSAVDSFVVSTVSYAQASNMTWPFVTIPNFSTRAAKVRVVSKTAEVILLPVVSDDEREEWNFFSLREGTQWVQENLRVQRNDPTFSGNIIKDYEVSPIYNYGGEIASNQSEYLPMWQAYPTSSSLFLPFNWDALAYFSLANAINSLHNKQAVVGGVTNDPSSPELAYIATQFISDYVDDSYNMTEPFSELFYPVFENAADEVSNSEKSSDGSTMVAVIMMSFFWRDLLLDLLPTGIEGLDVVFENACNQVFTYRINGPDVDFLGYGDQHDSQYDIHELSSSLVALKALALGNRLYTGVSLADKSSCAFSLRIYPSEVFEQAYISPDPWVFTVLSVAIFIFTSIIFFCYDALVERRQRKVLSAAVKSSAIVSSLFPANVRARLYGDGKHKPNEVSSSKNRLRTFINDAPTNSVAPREARDHPIADLFPEATVMFGDIAGFTAWSSTREPSQVFILLETLYGMFDKVASKRQVFKVETIGDSYMAVAGLPEARPDHAVVMAKFARDCCARMMNLTAELAIKLGPDTEDLAMRFGLNSGPVTAGVLRGEKSRFQLFGDTVNTAARMESTGYRHRIQASQSTADELIKHGKNDWLTPRKDTVEVKGKGLMQTYWVASGKGLPSSDGLEEAAASSPGTKDLHGKDWKDLSVPKDQRVKADRLIDWNTDVLAKLIRRIVARRQMKHQPEAAMTSRDTELPTKVKMSTGLVIDEVKETIDLPDFCPDEDMDALDSIDLDPTVQSQLREYVAAVAETYGGATNPFHNFAHASHVCMSVAKLMSRIIAAGESYNSGNEDGASSLRQYKHQMTFGITSDPLTLFACAFAALIHDAGHPGVPNTQLVKEGTSLASRYHNRSVAEQHSVDIAWDLLTEERFSDLLWAICPTQGELQQFRQLVVNSVMATDIMDQDLKNLRNERWERAFDHASICTRDSTKETMNRKATIVIEHLIQASDVAHTMQHWHVYRKWNERLFFELYKAYKEGRAEKNPADFWYQGELGFFDSYIIPLAKKLNECGVFGVSSDEYLGYAQRNRQEWQLKGEAVVAKMMEKIKKSSKLETSSGFHQLGLDG